MDPLTVYSFSSLLKKLLPIDSFQRGCGSEELPVPGLRSVQLKNYNDEPKKLEGE
jgi:hypothetical protein